jgi:hypothetical protein
LNREISHREEQVDPFPARTALPAPPTVEIPDAPSPFALALRREFPSPLPRPSRAAVALWIAFYNFCWVHETLRCTPAMELGVTDHVWSIAELITEALATPETPKPGPQSAPTTQRRGRLPFRGLRVIQGGKVSPKRER